MSIVIPEDTTESTDTETKMSDRDVLDASYEMLKEIHTVMMYLGKTVKQINESPGGVMKLLMGGLGRK